MKKAPKPPRGYRAMRPEERPNWFAEDLRWTKGKRWSLTYLGGWEPCGSLMPLGHFYARKKLWGKIKK